MERSLPFAAENYFAVSRPLSEAKIAGNMGCGKASNILPICAAISTVTELEHGETDSKVSTMVN
jgi:molybdenum cofactor biosynthesis enzyme